MALNPFKILTQQILTYYSKPKIIDKGPCLWVPWVTKTQTTLWVTKTLTTLEVTRIQTTACYNLGRLICLYHSDPTLMSEAPSSKPALFFHFKI